MDENQQLITGHCIDNDTSANTIQICSFPAWGRAIYKMACFVAHTHVQFSPVAITDTNVKSHNSTHVIMKQMVIFLYQTAMLPPTQHYIKHLNNTLLTVPLD